MKRNKRGQIIAPKHKNVKAIIVDLVGVMVSERKLKLATTENKLEKKFGVINFDNEYYKWAKQNTGLEKFEINKRVKKIFQDIYIKKYGFIYLFFRF